MGTIGITLAIPKTLHQQSQQQQQAPQTKEKFNMVSPPGFNNYVVNELHQDVQNVHWGNLKYWYNLRYWYKYTKDTCILDIVVTNVLKRELNEFPC